MRLARVRTHLGAVPVEWSDGEWHAIDDLFADAPRRIGERFAADAPLAAPVEPRIVLGMAHNSGAADAELPPQAFAKSARTVVGPGDPIVLDPAVGAVVAEGELAVVVRRRARHLRAEDVAAHVLGFTIGNDVTAVDQIARDSLLLQAKNGDGFTPLGPWIETGLDPAGLGIRAEAGGGVATGSVDGLARGVVELLVYLTGVLELGPGDVVLTGCPGTAVPIGAGDTARIRIDGLGELTNPVVAAGGLQRGSA
ncbi:fumarylacetoacetate hydrolase family protein [Leifsonia aquatica]|uniref:fumarylacetoacetate hydrolase family protein n=1 Tax=Leifsonia aquatica TaxID=144185 RepID=UPI0028AE9988|nr:fumarylacetoacetate hydrolase family protein [Leifsonia aquatica]